MAPSPATAAAAAEHKPTVASIVFLHVAMIHVIVKRRRMD
jgi:hypothetical protein